jgi:hypothetical protein
VRYIKKIILECGRMLIMTDMLYCLLCDSYCPTPSLVFVWYLLHS